MCGLKWALLCAVNRGFERYVVFGGQLVGYMGVLGKKCRLVIDF